MVELFRYLEANGFTNYIASGGDRDFMRPVTGPIYGIPPERVVGSSNSLRYVDDEARWIDRLSRRTGRVRRWPSKAGSDLEQDRSPSHHRRGEFERRHSDAPLRRRSPTDPPCASLSSMMILDRRVRLRHRVRGRPKTDRGRELDCGQRQERLEHSLRRYVRAAQRRLKNSTHRNSWLR